MTSNVIALDQISMGYRIYNHPFDIVKETLLGGVRHDTFWALRDVSLTVNEGERLGIVGPNGAGKSTLLKIICGNLTPTSGDLSVNGRISSLLSMSPAWNIEENGIENIKYNLMLEGVPRARIPAIIEDIVDFTELGQFIHQPVKTYSTGMGARLSFAIATATDPDILIIDEVLGTGDGYFAGKATARMKEFCARGRALIFVSHSISAVQQMCNRAVWMQNGSIRMRGDSDTVIAKYELDYRKAEDETTRAVSIARASSAQTAPDPTEIDSDAVRLRIVPKNGARFSATYYIREIAVTNATSGERISVPLALSLDRGEYEQCALDLLTSEWARFHDRHGTPCRILQRMSGRNPGGHILLRGALAEAGDDRKLRLTVGFDVACDDTAEDLVVQVLDLRMGEWQRLGEVKTLSDDGEWVRIVTEGELELVAGQIAESTRDRLRRELAQPVQIGKVMLTADDTEVHVVDEGQPFSIVVEANFSRKVEIADVGVKLTRTDGVYAFWQSSGMSPAGNLKNAEGMRSIEFRFDDNIIGAGEYTANIYVANGWDFPNNYPYSEIFDRKFNALSFRIEPKNKGVDLGIIARTFEVVVS